MNANDKIDRIIDLEDKLSRAGKWFAEQCAPFKKEIDVLKNELFTQMEQEGVRNVKGKAGTAYISTIVTPKVVDRDAYLDVVMDNYDTWGSGMLQLREPKKEAIDEYQRDHDGKLPDGVEVSSFMRVNIRRS